MHTGITRNDISNERIILLLGDPDRNEMRPLVLWLHQLVSQSFRLVYCQDVNSLWNPVPPVEQPSDKLGAPTPFSGSLKTAEFPDLIIVLQSWPDEYSSQDVSNLLAHAPLARLVVCCGSWCESLGRNRDLWPVSVRVPVWAAPSRIQREWQLIQNPTSPNPPPWSASREEVFADDHQRLENWFESETVAVNSPDPSYQQFLLEMMKELGVQVARANASVLLLDADPWNQSRADILKQYRNESSQMVIVALVDQVHPSFMAELLDLGATLVVQKLGFHRQLPPCCTKATCDQTE